MKKRVLLDEGVPRQLTVPLIAAGFVALRYPNKWKQITNGELLARAEAEQFDILITNDKNMFAQQNLRGRRIAIIVLPTNLRREVLALADSIVRDARRIPSRSMYRD